MTQVDDTGVTTFEELLASYLARLVDGLEKRASQARHKSASTRATPQMMDHCVDACLAWLLVARHASGLQRALAAWASRRGAQAPERRLLAAETIAACAGIQSEAEAADAAWEDAVRRQARLGLGLRVAVAGKGGAGKTAIAGTMARLRARDGHKVLAIDLDPNPGLASCLGMPLGVAGVSEDVLERHDVAAVGEIWTLSSAVSPYEIVEHHTVAGPGGIRYLSPGKVDRVEHHVARAAQPVLDVALGFHEPGWDVIADLDAGPRRPFGGAHSFAEQVVVVAEPGWSSVLTARRLLPLVADVPAVVVANKLAEGDDARPGELECQVRIPFDACLEEADRLGIAPLDHCGESPAVAAIAGLIQLLAHEEVRR